MEKLRQWIGRNRSYIIRLTLFVTLTSSFEGVAYYESDKNEEQLFLFQPHQSDLSTFQKGRRRFVIYDNFKNPLERYHQKQLIFPASNQFVPIDFINFEFTVYNVLGHRLVGKYSMTNFIYANLRLGKIKEDYEAAQLQAKRLLSGLETPFEKINLDSLISPTKNSDKKSNTVKKDFEDKEESVHAKRSRPKRKSNQQVGKPKPKEEEGSEVENKSVHLKIQRLKRHSNLANKRARRLQSEEGREMMAQPDPNTGGLPGPNLVAQPKPFSYEKSFTQEVGRLKNPVQQRKASRVSTNPSNRSYSDHDRQDAPLPLIFQIPSDLAHYLLANKLEAFICGMIMIFLIGVITSLRPRSEGGP